MAARRVEGVQLERAADEILAVRTATMEAHALNQSAAAVYELCDGKTSKSQMAAEIRRRTGLPADEEIVDLALAELVDAGLVVLDDPEPRSTITRRSLVRRFAVRGGGDDAPGGRDHPGTAGGGGGAGYSNETTQTRCELYRRPPTRRSTKC